jgi:urease accessory protein
MNVCNRVERAAANTDTSGTVDSYLHESETHPTADLSSAQPAEDTITLDETERHRRRIVLCSDNGIRFLLDLEHAVLLKHGDVLRLEDGRGIQVKAKPETLYAVFGRDTTHLLRLAWHVGNRHIASQIMADHLLIKQDHVIGKMLEELGAKVTVVESGFDPEGGAYGDAHQAHAHHHDHAPSSNSA